MKHILILFLLFFIISALWGQEREYFQQDVAYTIEITLDPLTQTYQGTETLVYKNNSPDTLNFIWFHLYPNAYKNENTPFARQQEEMRERKFYFSEENERGYLNLESVQIRGTDINWEFKEDAIDEAKLFLPEPLPPSQSVTINLQFNAKFPIVFSRSGHWSGRYYNGAQWYPKVVVYDKYGWHPDSYLERGEFYGEFGTFDVSITLPKNFVIEATGVLQDNPAEEAFNNSIIADTKKLCRLVDEDVRDDFVETWQKQMRSKTDYSKTKTVRFFAENVHDFAWFAGIDFMIHQKKAKDGVTVKTLVLPKNAFDWRFTPDYTERTLYFYGDRVGKYKYPKVTVIDGTHETFGGMEYPMITLITINYAKYHNLLEMVISHEVGHNWFQGMLGSNERASIFLDEGVNTFFDTRNMVNKYGRKSLTKFDSLLGNWNTLSDLGEWDYHMLVYGDVASRGREQKMVLPAEKISRTSYSAMNYDKAFFMLSALRWMIGEQIFDRAIKAYFERWHFKHPELDDFWNIMEEFSGENLVEFRKEWMETTHYQDFKIKDYDSEKSGSGYETKVYVENVGTMKNFPAPVHLVTTAGDTLEGRWNGDEQQAVIFKHQAPLAKVEANLKRTFFEIDYLNNSSFPDIEFTFLDVIPSFDTYKFTFYPYLGYEYFKDGVRLGTGFWAGNPLFRNYFLTGSAYYATESGKIGYALAFKHRFPGLILNYSNIYAGIKDKDGYKNIHSGIEIYYANPANYAWLPIITLEFNYQKLYDMNYHEAGIYQPAKYTTATLKLRNRYRSMLWNTDMNVLLEKPIDILDSGAGYLKFEFKKVTKFYLSENIEAGFDIYTGVVDGDNIPLQEYIFAGGNVDPKHESLALGYRGSVAPLRSFLVKNGMDMPGYAHYKRNYLRNNAGLSIGAEIDFPWLPIIYGRTATLSEKYGDLIDQRFFSEAGIKFENNVFSAVFPVYISHPVGNEKNFDLRFYFSLESPLNFY